MIGIIVAIMLVCACLPARAGDDGGTESVFNLGAGARAMGMGNGFVALSDDATAVYYNPAGMPYLPSQQITFLHTILFEETIYDYISYVYPLDGVNGLGFAAMRIGTDNIGRRDAVTDIGQFDASQTQLFISYGRVIQRRFSAGATVKLVNQSIADLSAYGYGFDLAGRMTITDRIRLGALFQDVIGARIKLADSRERTPFTIRVGGTYLFEAKRWPLNGAITLDLEKPEHRSIKLRTGFEVAHTRGIVLRGGYDRDNISMGLGIIYQNLRFDYAYKFIENLTDSHRFSLTFGFGQTKEERTAASAEENRDVRIKAINESRQKSLMDELERANAFYDAGQLDSALASYYRAEAFSEDNAFIRSRIQEIERKRAVAQPTIITEGGDIIKSSTDFESQARSLYQRNALAAARDIIALARQYRIESSSLDSLEMEVNTAISQKVASSLATAREAYRNGNFISAYDNYNTVLNLDPGNAEARTGSQRSEKNLDVAQHVSLALTYFNQGKYISSQREFKTVLSLDSGNTIAKDYLSQIDSRIKESTSLEDLQKDSRIWQLYLDGLEAFRQGNYQQAIDNWEDVLEVYPNNKNTIENIEQAKLRLNK